MASESAILAGSGGQNNYLTLASRPAAVHWLRSLPSSRRVAPMIPSACPPISAITGSTPLQAAFLRAFTATPGRPMNGRLRRRRYGPLPMDEYRVGLATKLAEFLMFAALVKRPAFVEHFFER